MAMVMVKAQLPVPVRRLRVLQVTLQERGKQLQVVAQRVRVARLPAALPPAGAQYTPS